MNGTGMTVDCAGWMVADGNSIDGNVTLYFEPEAPAKMVWGDNAVQGKVIWIER